MKNLNYKEFLEAPHKVQFLYMMAMTKQPTGSEMIESAIKEHPEYFPDELEHRRKWALIPQSVHDKYWEERSALSSKMFIDMPESKGILGWIDDPTGFAEWNKKWKECYEKEKPLAEALHNKYYAEYGIKWNGV